MAGLKGTSLDKDAEDLICNHHIGGFILFGRNFENPRQLAAFINDLQALALSMSSGTPLFISVDQEGGRVARLKEPFTEYPFAGVLGIAKSEDLAYKFGCALATELSAVGINMDFAPVLDVNSNLRDPTAQHPPLTIGGVPASITIGPPWRTSSHAVTHERPPCGARSSTGSGAWDSSGPTARCAPGGVCAVPR